MTDLLVSDLPALEAEASPAPTARPAKKAARAPRKTSAAPRKVAARKKPLKAQGELPLIEDNAVPVPVAAPAPEPTEQPAAEDLPAGLPEAEADVHPPVDQSAPEEAAVPSEPEAVAPDPVAVEAELAPEPKAAPPAGPPAEETVERAVAPRLLPETREEQEPEAEPEAARSVPPAPELPPLPESISFNEFHEKTVMELYHLANDLNIRLPAGKSKRQMIAEILSWHARRGVKLTTTGILDIMPEGFGFIRWTFANFTSAEDDVYVPLPLIKRFQLRAGQELSGTVKLARERGDKPFGLDFLAHIEGQPTDQWQAPKPYDLLTALFPNERIILEHTGDNPLSGRVVDLVAPLGKGQRGLIVASPRSGKTILLKDIARSITHNHPEAVLMIVLVDERPEEVTDFEETVAGAQVFASTFDEPPRRHIQLAELVMERAKRLVEMGKDVIILLDSITRLSRGYNASMSQGGRTMSGGIDSKALIKPKKFFGAARKAEEGGSLTVLATALVGTENRMDDVIFEEFKGTGNMEIYLDRELSERRIYPAIHSLKSGTRKDELLYHPDEFKRITLLRRQMTQLPAGEAMEKLIGNVKNTQNNAELLLAGLR